MTDEEYLKRQFENDSREKKRIAQGEKHRVKSKHGMKTPSDYLTAKERKKLNGEVTTYELNKAMHNSEFKCLPNDLQKEYLEKLQTVYHISNRELAEMLGVAHATVGNIRNRLGVPAIKVGDYHKNFNRKVWEKFLSGAPLLPCSANTDALIALQEATHIIDESPEVRAERERKAIEDTVRTLTMAGLISPKQAVEYLPKRDTETVHISDPELSDVEQLLKLLKSTHARVTIEFNL